MSVPPPPPSVSGGAWRPLVPQDAASIVALLEAVEAVDRFGWIEPLEEWEAEFQNPDVDWPGDSLGLFAGDGALLAAGIVFYSRNDEKQRNYLWGHVRPDVRRRGIGNALLGWQLRRAEERSPIDGSERLARLHVLERHEDRRGLAERHGFAFNRYFVDMCRPSSEPIDPGEIPAGLRVEPWSSAHSEAARIATNAAFADHWGSLPRSAEVWKMRHDDHPHFRPDLSFLALAGDDVVSVSLVWVNHDSNRSLGTSEAWIGTVGTVREWRRRGVASALIRASLQAIGHAGLEEAWLGVDTEGETRALDVYARLGFTEQRRELAFVREF